MFKLRSPLLMIFIFFALCLNAQQASNKTDEDKCKVNVKADQTVDIEFSNAKKIDHLLIIMFDPLGNTLFMDSQYNFTGLYKHSVNLNKVPPGNYYLKINSDNERISRIINIQ